MFQFPGLPPAGPCIRPAGAGPSARCVLAFGGPRILGRLPLPAGYRSLPRPSSASCAKASAVRPWRPASRGRRFFALYNIRRRAYALRLLWRCDRSLSSSLLLRCNAFGEIGVIELVFSHAMRLSRYAGGASPRNRTLRASRRGQAGAARPSCLPRKEVIQPHVPVRLPCYDFTPLTLHTFGASPPRGLGRRLRVQTTRVV